MYFDNKEIHPRIERISYLMTQKSPFLSEFLLRYSYYRVDQIKTMATGINDGRIVLFWNKEFIDSLDDDELEGVLIHEIYHIITLSQRRGKGKNKTLWNYATDAVNNQSIINSTLNGRKIILPRDSGVFMKHFYDDGYNGKVVAESVYDFLNKNSKSYSFVQSSSNNKDKSDEGKSEEGSNSSSSSNKKNEDKESNSKSSSSKENGEDLEENNSSNSSSNSGEDSPKESGEKEIKVFDDHDFLDEEEISEVNVEIIRNMTKDAEVKGWGNLKGDLSRVVQEVLKPKKANISQLLKNKLSEHFSNSGSQINTWKRKNRRGLPLPGKIRTKSKINVFIDNSGSCWSDSIAALFFGQLEDFAKTGYDISVYSFDTRVFLVKEKYKLGDYKNLRLLGGGGTAVQPIFDLLKESNKDKESSIILTDGYFNWNFNDYNIHTLWLLTEKGYFDRAPKDRRFFLEVR